MIAYLKGSLEVKGRDYIIVETSGIGYYVTVPLTAIEKLEKGSEIKVLTYLAVREDGWQLYGFLNDEELKMFQQLIKISGIGPKAAMAIVSNISPSQFAFSVLTDDVEAFVKAPGIGKKTAQRIILELKDKLKKEQALDVESFVSAGVNSSDFNQSKTQEAVSALMMLGYSCQEANLAVSKAFDNEKTIEEIIKDSLKALGSKF